MLCLTLLLIHLAVSMSSSSPDRHLPRCIVGSGEVVVLVVVCRMAGVVLLVASRCMWMMKNSGEGGGVGSASRVVVVVVVGGCTGVGLIVSLGHESA